MHIDAYLSLGVVAAAITCLAVTSFSADIVMMGALTALLMFGILTPAEALGGFSNEGLATIAVLYIVVAGLRETGVVHWISRFLLGRTDSETVAQLKVMVPVSLLSAFINNTPVVAMLVPAVSDWCKSNNLQVSKLMMPLSYAAIIGGTCTLVGTSTNLIVNGMLLEIESVDQLALFELAWVGLPLTIAVIAFVLLFGRWLLPSRGGESLQFEDVNQYIIEMLVEADSSLVGKSVEEAGLTHIPGLYLIEIDRNGFILPAVSPRQILRSEDRLIFAGVVDSVVDLQKIPGLRPATNHMFKLDTPRTSHVLIEAVVASACPLVGKTIRQGRFRKKYNAAIIAVARNGEHVKQKLENIRLRVGDMLLLEAHHEFNEQHRNSKDFLLIRRLEDSEPVKHDKAWIAMLIVAGMFVFIASGMVSMFMAALGGAALMILSGATSSGYARRQITWQVLIVIGASIGVGQALLKTGAAEYIADIFVQWAGSDPVMVLSTVFFVTALLTAAVTNVAAAVLMFPMILTISTSLDIELIPIAVTLMIAASTAFATPIGYQTNLMVYGPGRYRFSDFGKIGVPLTLLVGFLTVLLVPIIWPL
jgi:di/tricarboxylate transporter